MMDGHAGYSGTPLATKLGIGDGDRVAALGAPAGFGTLLDPLPPGARLVRAPRGRRCYPVVVGFARTPADLRRRFARGEALMEVDGGLWIAWPKQSSPLAGDLREGHVREHGLAAGLVDNKICAVDADWSALRFVVRRRHRAARRNG
jgi:hypothetical protein